MGTDKYSDPKSFVERVAGVVGGELIEIKYEQPKENKWSFKKLFAFLKSWRSK
jgi:hypothetical protein